MAYAQVREDIVEHMGRHHGVVHDSALVERGAASGIELHVIPPLDTRNPIVIFTTGMSEAPQAVPPDHEAYRYTELLIRLRGDWPLDQQSRESPNFGWPFEWLQRIASYLHLNDTWLGGPYTIISNDEAPQPFAPGTAMSCMLLLKEPGSAGTVRCRGGRQIALYSMVPLFTEERDLEKRGGIAELLGQFQQQGVPPWVDPKRANVAAP